MKASNKEKLYRLNVVSRLLRKGAKRLDIYRYCEVNFGIKARQSDTYIREAKEKLRAERERALKRVMSRGFNDLKFWLIDNWLTVDDRFNLGEALVEEIDSLVSSLSDNDKCEAFFKKIRSRNEYYEK